MYTTTQKKRHVALLQNALQTLGYPICPDGIFDEATTKTVRRFQQEEGLPPTGQVDRETWKRAMWRSEQTETHLRPPAALQLPKSAFPAADGLAVGVAQLALGELSQAFPNIRAVEPTMCYDEDTHRQMEQIRVIWALPPSERLEQADFDALMRLVNMPLASGSAASGAEPDSRTEALPPQGA